MRVVGDLDGDGVADVLICSDLADIPGTRVVSNAGVVIAVSGQTGSVIWKRYGNAANDSLKMADVVGDYNGDGVGEVVVTMANGLPIDPDNLSASDGHASVVVTMANGLPSDPTPSSAGRVLLLSGADGGILFSFSGARDSDFLDYYLGAPYNRSLQVPSTSDLDFDQDGQADLVLVATGGDVIATSDNRGYLIVFGSRTLTETYRLNGDFTNDATGQKLLFPGDLSGDSIPDLVVATPDADSAQGANDNVGRVTAVNGANGAVLYSVLGRHRNDAISRTNLRTLPDINGDGIKELIVGNSNANSSGTVSDSRGLTRIISGSTGNIIRDIVGAQAQESLGGYIEAPDLDSDGKHDFVLFNSFFNNLGYFKAYSSQSGTMLWQLTGSTVSGYLGYQTGKRPLLILRDIDNDGVPEIGIGERKTNKPGGPNGVGLARIISGATGQVLHTEYGDSPVATQEQAPSTEELTSVDVEQTAFFTVGDFNQDGVEDIGIKFISASDGKKGSIKILSGSDFQLLLYRQGVKTLDYLGVNDVITPGDLNGDGYPEIVVASEYANSLDNSRLTVGVIQAVGVDTCPDDGDKSAPGDCGCGVSDVDDDSDGMLSCFETCPNDPGKSDAGVCGCGVADSDSDGDSIFDCFDGCPQSQDKVAPGVCGCSMSDEDLDGDDVPLCLDACPEDPEKTAPGQCGCSIPDTDVDGSGIADCFYEVELVSKAEKIRDKVNTIQSASLIYDAIKSEVGELVQYFNDHRLQLQFDRRNTAVTRQMVRLQRSLFRLSYLSKAETNRSFHHRKLRRIARQLTERVQLLIELMD